MQDLQGRNNIVPIAAAIGVWVWIIILVVTSGGGA